MKNSLIVISAVWCPSCLILKKQLKRIQEQYQLNYKMLDYDMDEDIVKKYYKGDKLPVIVYNDKILIGEKSNSEIENFLRECNLL